MFLRGKDVTFYPLGVTANAGIRRPGAALSYLEFQHFRYYLSRSLAIIPDGNMAVRGALLTAHRSFQGEKIWLSNAVFVFFPLDQEPRSFGIDDGFGVHVGSFGGLLSRFSRLLENVSLFSSLDALMMNRFERKNSYFWKIGAIHKKIHIRRRPPTLVSLLLPAESFPPLCFGPAASYC
jgi:hypothetical protein